MERVPLWRFWGHEAVSKVAQPPLDGFPLLIGIHNYSGDNKKRLVPWIAGPRLIQKEHPHDIVAY